jgi:hypothetical protein
VEPAQAFEAAGEPAPDVTAGPAVSASPMPLTTLVLKPQRMATSADMTHESASSKASASNAMMADEPEPEPKTAPAKLGASGSELQANYTPMYQVLRDVDVDSKFTGGKTVAKLAVGAIVSALDYKPNKDGILRVRLQNGWVSLTDKKGNKQLDQLVS